MSNITVGQAEASPDGTISLTLNINLNSENDAEPENMVDPTEPNIVTFWYDGYERKVQNPQLKAGARRWGKQNVLLAGIELSRGGISTEEYKQYSLDKIEV